MKNIFLAFLFLTISSGVLGQEIEKITFTSKQHDEPPTKQGMPEFKIEYIKDSSGNFTANHYLKDKKKLKLGTPITIEKQRINVIELWNLNDVNEFKLLEFGINKDQIKKRANENDYKLNFSIPDNPTIQIDTFNICQNWRMFETIIIGGWEQIVTISYSNGLKNNYKFDSSDFGIGEFDMKGFIISYSLLAESIPSQIPQDDFFTKGNFEKITLDYFKTIECEGFYYNEFKINNPERIPAENRMRKGWDFLEYMKMRGKE